MPTPREIALQTNAGIEPVSEEPTEINGHSLGGATREADYRANPTNPPDGALPASNLKK